MTLKRRKCILVDTCVLMDYPYILEEISQNGNFPFVTNTILEELDFNKKGKLLVNKNVRFLLKEFANEFDKTPKLPNRRSLKKKDKLSCVLFQGNQVFVVHRKTSIKNTQNDEKIREIALDYGLILLTKDNAMKVRACAVGIQAEIWVPQPIPLIVAANRSLVGQTDEHRDSMKDEVYQDTTVRSVTFTEVLNNAGKATLHQLISLIRFGR